MYRERSVNGFVTKIGRGGMPSLIVPLILEKVRNGTVIRNGPDLPLSSLFSQYVEVARLPLDVIERFKRHNRQIQ